MSSSSPRNHRIEAFDFAPGRMLAGKYEIERKLGAGWEGEVYRVIERKTDVHRAAKFFFPHRNKGDKAVKFYARKLERLKKCSIVIAYHHSETIRYRSTPITCLISEFVEGELWENFIKRQRGGRLPPFEAMHLIYWLTRGMEEIHAMGEYHGDLHAGNVLVNRKGICFDLKIVDFYQWGRATPAHLKDDVVDMVRLLYDAVGGRRHYARQPEEIKSICRGLRRDLITRRFPTARHLREYLETFAWPER